MRPKFSDASLPAFLTAKEYKAYSIVNATSNAEGQQTEASLSSAVALSVVLFLIFSVITMSLATFCLHKWKLKIKKLQKAHEEYQKDHEKNGLPDTSAPVFWLVQKLR